MELVKKIELLIEKYFAAETTVAEEQELRNYFSQTDVAPHLQAYQPMFVYFSTEQQESYSKTVSLKPRRKKYLAWISVAAMIAIVVSVWVANPFQPNNLGTYEDPEIAFQETQKALEFLSANLNLGIEEIGHLKEFEQAKNKILKNN
ncbi:hypothetical protein SAMN04487906_0698 [Zhouia amylolytica]|uniref:Uncharacterized protein n=2 Tax=Zhouia amylolytica TaxID=376730 RepID=W2UPS0_9FLAO|nr:hypothetical protein [Zhouia amylolytica]ETN95939.1 hypothetical protein P278_16610 [Zhouia amylolytica AD3]SFS52767.1 hypothetical protein SAMN04487906_0698 [Zhouia amylolytica]